MKQQPLTAIAATVASTSPWVAQLFITSVLPRAITTESIEIENEGPYEFQTNA